MTSAIYRVVRLCLILIPVVLAVTWVTARRYADGKERQVQAAERRRSGSAITACRMICMAAQMYAAEHDMHLPPANRWEQALRPYLKDISWNLPCATDGEPRRFAMNRALGGQNLDHINTPTQTILFYESTVNNPNAADDLTSLPRPDDHSGFAIGWADGHCYYRYAADRSYLIEESMKALKSGTGS